MTRRFYCEKCGAETVHVAGSGPPAEDDMCFACGHVEAMAAGVARIERDRRALPWWLRKDWRWRG